MRRMRLLVDQILSKFDLQVSRISNSYPNLLLLESKNDIFRSLMQEVESYTLVTKPRCFLLHEFAKHTANIKGDVAEVGVYKGGTARIISKAFAKSNKVIHLFDTFSGMPPTDPDKDLLKEGVFSVTSLDNIQKRLADCNNIRFYQGFFPDTSDPVTHLSFCFVHVGVDIYNSVMSCCQFFYPRMEKGGIMVFDDYGFQSCPGAKIAVDEFFNDKPEHPCCLPTGQCIVIKL